MAEYTPDKWVIVHITDPEGQTINKVLAGWSGGYTSADSWQLNSGIERIEDAGDCYKIHGYSGSVYNCSKSAEGLTKLTQNMLTHWKDILPKKGSSIEVISINEI